MIRKLYLSAVPLCCAILLFSSVTAVPDTLSDFEPLWSPTLKINRLNGSIKIDGIMDDDGWRSAAVISNFSEVSPGDQVRPPVESRALLTYDDSYLYVALIAYDDPSQVRTSLRDRDRIFADDYFGIMLDTYGNYAWGYELFVNPDGIQGDLRVVAGGGEDASFDIVFESRGMVTDSGYQVELAIPFSSLRFPDREVQTWRFNVWRDHQREVRRQYSWAAIDRNNPCWLCQWGTLTGIENIKPGTNLDILPNIIAFQSGGLTDGPASSFDNSNPEAELSLNLRYGLTPNSSIEATINPDFSQVESDAARIDVNTTFGLYFPERRPFFQEGSDLFQTRINAVYTRSINDPEVAGKFTGQYGRTSVGYLLARDEHSPIVIPLSEQSGQVLAGKSTSNIFRVRQSFFQDSFVGLLLTDRRLEGFKRDGLSFGSGSGSVYGFDGRVRIAKNYQIRWQALGSQTSEMDADGLVDVSPNGLNQTLFGRDRYTVALDGESYSGHALSASTRYNSRHLNLNVDYSEYSPTFRTDNGFTARNDHRQADIGSSLNFSPNRDVLVNWGLNLRATRIWTHDGRFRDEWIYSSLYLQLIGQTNINLDYTNSRERFRDILFEGISEGTISVSSRFSELFSGGVQYGYGKRIYRGSPEMADKRQFVSDVILKPTERLNMSASYSYLRMNSRIDGSKIFSGYVLRSRADYQFTREWFVRVILQYDKFSDRVDIDPLLTYRVNPFTVFYVGMTNRLQYFSTDDYNDISQSVWKISSRQFFAKLQYLFRV